MELRALRGYYFAMSRNNEGGRFAALGHPTRQAILAHLRSRDYVRVGDIAAAVGVSGATLSGHLRTLRDAELVVARRRGTEIQYRINLTAIDEAILLLTALRGPSAVEGESTTGTDGLSGREEERG